MGFSIETRCQHLADEQSTNSQNSKDHYGAISYPIYQTATFAHPAVGESTGYDYSRLQNPTREHVENVVAALEEGACALAFSSGMAAISALMEMFRPGDHLIVDADLYGGSIRLFEHITRKNGIEFTRVNCNEEELEPFITGRTRAVFIETPTNPMMNVTDIRELANTAKRHGLLLIVDNTFLSPYFQNPLKLGADIVVHSGTKFLGGHNDTIAGFVVTNDEAVGEELRFIIKTTGAGLSPFDSWLILRGIKTLAVRMERAQENAGKLSCWLEEQEIIKKVIYPGLPSHPGYEIMKKQCSGFGTMLTFETESKNAALAILKNVRLISFAESLGGTETLITYPITQTHADVPENVRQKNGITDCILRMSVGIEKIEDIIADLNNAFASIL
ncbi:trans-sulfuration enzyme family protein [Sporofaciens musculi]|uniref:trans-sulfuration enzyme family protein n=1 Tax=Sporofaciens musculi TaxID=2681861 RepID=UPI00256FCB49|nr:PLP-dependent aspartate aminotransferase family protein [Sporofaciens musculi]